MLVRCHKTHKHSKTHKNTTKYQNVSCISELEDWKEQCLSATFKKKKKEGSDEFLVPTNIVLTSFNRFTSHDNEHTEKNLNLDCICEEILIADDDIFNLMSLEMILKSLNKVCVKAINGKEALEKVTMHRCQSINCHGFRLVLMDYQMPIMDGVTSTYEIMRLEEEEGFRVPIVIGCTAFTTKNEVKNCLDSGMKDVVFKPLSKEIIGRVLREWLNG